MDGTVKALNNVLIRLHGDENISYVPLNDISKDQYALSDLERKDLNIDNEPSGGVIKSSALLKKLSGRESVRVQQKYIKAHDARLHAKLWCSTNDTPNISDDSIGRYRREIVIMYPFTFKPNLDPRNPMEKQDDPEIEDKITTAEELSGILNMLMDELHDILYKQKKRFIVDMSEIDSGRKHMEPLKSPIQYFVDEAIEVDVIKVEYIRKDDLYEAYTHFSKLNMINPTDKENFGKQIKRILKDDVGGNQRDGKKDPITGKRPTIWKGIQFKESWKDKDKRDKQTSSLELQKEDEDEEVEEKQDQQQEENNGSETEESSEPFATSNGGEKKATQMSGQNPDSKHSLQQYEGE